MGEPIKKKTDENYEVDILKILLVCKCVFCVSVACFLLLVVGIEVGVDFGQPQPTSILINKSINLSVWDPAFPGFQNEFYDSDGNGYYYIQWFKPLAANHIYNITYYCNQNGDRQIYTYFDEGKEKTNDKAKCIVINGVCQ